MNFKLLFIFSLIVSCGVKSLPQPETSAIIPSYVDQERERILLKKSPSK